MSFAPVLPIGGYAGWAFLKRTMQSQTAVMLAQPAMQRDEAYFRERIGRVNSADELVADRRLLRITLEAFGLEGDLDNRFFIRKVLGDGTLDPGALSNRLADKRYHGLATAFGFGDLAVPRNRISDFADRMLAQRQQRVFETAVGTRDESLRLALNARRELPEVLRRNQSDDARWFTIMGQPPLRQVFETAFGLPKAFGALDIDRQLGIFKEKARAVLGSDSPARLAEPEVVESLIRRFLLRAEPGSTVPFGVRGAGALQLLAAGR